MVAAQQEVWLKVAEGQAKTAIPCRPAIAVHDQVFFLQRYGQILDCLVGRILLNRNEKNEKVDLLYAFSFHFIVIKRTIIFNFHFIDILLST